MAVKLLPKINKNVKSILKYIQEERDSLIMKKDKLKTDNEKIIIIFKKMKTEYDQMLEIVETYKQAVNKLKEKNDILESKLLEMEENDEIISDKKKLKKKNKLTIDDILNGNDDIEEEEEEGEEEEFIPKKKKKIDNIQRQILLEKGKKLFKTTNDMSELQRSRLNKMNNFVNVSPKINTSSKIKGLLNNGAPVFSGGTGALQVG